MRTGWWPAVLMALAGCMEAAQLDYAPALREGPSILPNFPGEPRDVYPVLLVHGLDPQQGSWAFCSSWSPLEPPFYHAPKVDNRAPYLSGGCDRSSELGSLWEAKLFLNRTKFDAKGSDAYVLHGYASQSSSGSSRCCLFGDHAYRDKPFKFVMGGKNFTVEMLEGASYRLGGDAIPTTVLKPGHFIEYDLLTPSKKGNLAYEVRFENPGTWPRSGLKHPKEDWTPCTEPRGFLCHVTWNGVPPPEIWKPGKVVPKPDDLYLALNASQPTVAGLVAPLLKLPGWTAANLTRFELRQTDGMPADLWLRVQVPWGEMNVTRFTGPFVPSDCSFGGPDYRCHLHSPGPNDFYVRIANETGKPLPSIGGLNATLQGFNNLNLTQMREMAGLGPDFNVRLEHGFKYSYDWATEVTERARGTTPPYPQVWIHAAEPMTEADWRLIHEWTPHDAPGAPNIVVAAPTQPAMTVTFHVAPPSEPQPV